MKEFLLFCIVCLLFLIWGKSIHIESEIQKNDKIMQEKAKGLTDALIKLSDDTTKRN